MTCGLPTPRWVRCFTTPVRPRGLQATRGASGSFSLSAGDPTGITTDGSTIWVVDSGSLCVYKYDLVGNQTGAWNLNGHKQPHRSDDRSDGREQAASGLWTTGRTGSTSTIATPAPFSAASASPRATRIRRALRIRGPGGAAGSLASSATAPVAELARVRGIGDGGARSLATSATGVLSLFASQQSRVDAAQDEPQSGAAAPFAASPVEEAAGIQQPGAPFDHHEPREFSDEEYVGALDRAFADYEAEGFDGDLLAELALR